MHPFQRQGNLCRAGFQQALLFGQENLIQLFGQHGQHAAIAHRRLERQVEHGIGRQGLGAKPGRLLFVVDPLRHAQIGLRRAVVFGAQLLLAVGGEQHDAGIEQGLQAADGDVDDLVGGQGYRQLAAQVVQRPGAAFAIGGNGGFKAQARGQLADDQRHGKHHGKGEQILGVGYRQGQSWRHKEKVEGGHRYQGRQHAGAAAKAYGNQHHGQQVEHDHIGQVKKRCQHAHEAGGQQAGQQGGHIAVALFLPTGFTKQQAVEAFRWCCAVLVRLVRYHIDIDIICLPGQLFQQGAA